MAYQGNVSVLIVIFLMISAFFSPETARASNQFTVADDIALTSFSDQTFSPNGKFVAVLVDRGRLDLNKPESILNIYSIADIREFLADSRHSGNLKPLWAISQSTYKYGPIISKLQWTRDSTAMAFLAKTQFGNDRLFFAHIPSKRLFALTPEREHVTAFDLHDVKNYVYTLLEQQPDSKNQLSYVVGTAQSLETLLFSNEPHTPDVYISDLSALWAVVDGRRFRLNDARSGRPLPIHLKGQHCLALSPDGSRVVTALSFENIPPEWEQLYPPEDPSSTYRIRVGRVDPFAHSGQFNTSEFVLIDLKSKKVEHLTAAPMAGNIGWPGYSLSGWSSDSNWLVLSNTFLSLERSHRPCIAAVVDVRTNQSNCIVSNGKIVLNVGFRSGDPNVVEISYLDHSGSRLLERFVRQDRTWKEQPDAASLHTDNNLLELSVHESINEPPLLFATDRRTNSSAVIWNPNPQLATIRLGEVSVLTWKDKADRTWKGGLYKPHDFISGRRYPLVIQTHGFSEKKFLPSGSYPTVFAAQEMAAAGILVLQPIEDCPTETEVHTDREGACVVEGFEGAVKRLVDDGLVDPDRIGIMGFSRTCYHTLVALEKSDVRFRAALIADGVNESYLQFLVGVDAEPSNMVAQDAQGMNGAAPIREGLEAWLKRAPGFNMDKVKTPLEIVATAGPGILEMWEPYALLRYLKKPVDLVIFNSQEHVFTNPQQRLLSQGLTVDWFRFWLQDYEDPSSLRAEQYVRWRALREQ